MLSDKANSLPGSESEDPEAQFRVPKPKSGFSCRLVQAINEAGGVEAVALKSGIPRGSLYNYYRGVHEPKASALAKIAAAIDVSTDWLLNLSDSPRHGVTPRVQSQRASLIADNVMIGQLSFAASEGNGILVLTDLGKTFPVRPELLDRLDLQPEHTCMVEAVGTSMLPTIRDREVLLVDKSEAARSPIREGDIYLFTVDNEAFIKRLRRDPGQWIMVSDYQELFPPRPIPKGEHIAIIGRVCWGAHEL